MAKTLNQTDLIEQLQTGGLSATTLTAAALAVGFGVFLILGTGFLGAEVLHNAAHDTRHAISFPCH
jgi:cobalt transporter subunit CbtB